MTKTLSNDLRHRVIEYLKSGKSHKSCSDLFKISVTTAYRWYKKYLLDGSYEAKKRGGSKRKIDLSKLEEFVTSNPNMTLTLASDKFGVSIYTISYWLNKLGFSYKKNRKPMWKQI